MESLVRAAGLAPLTAPRFSGPEALFASPFRLAMASAAGLSFAASVAAELWRLRGGERQEIALDLQDAAAWLIAPALFRHNGQALAPAHPSTCGFFETADRRLLCLPGGIPPAVRRTLDLLNAKDDPAAVAAGVAKWNGLALEDALAYLELAGAVTRSAEEWQGTVAGRMIGAPIILKKTADSPSRRLEAAAAPLAGLRVLQLGRVLTGRVAGAVLASHGADVLQVTTGRLPLAGDDLVFSAGSRRTRLELTKPAEAEQMRALVRQADVVIDACHPGALIGMGFSPAALTAAAPGMIHVGISAFGTAGPWARRRGWESTVQAATGLAAEQGAFLAARQGRAARPERLPADVCSIVTGTLAAAGAMAAVLRRTREGGSWQMEVSLAATAAWLTTLGRIDAKLVPGGGKASAGLDQFLQICETTAGRFEFLGPVVRMSKTPPLRLALPDGVDLPFWASAHEDSDAAENQPAET